MIYCELIKGTNEVSWTHHKPFDEKYGLGKTREELEQTGVFVETMPEFEERIGKIPVRKVNFETMTIYYDFVDRPLSREELVEKQVFELQQTQKSASQKYAELDKTSTDIDTLRKAKLAELDEKCSLTIVSGFDHELNGVMYHFSTSLPAQANFTGTKVRFLAGEITEVEWTAVNKTTGKEERVVLDELTFTQLSSRVFDLIDSNVKKLRNTLQPQVESAYDAGDSVAIDVVNW